jgi:hypothetical protein
VPSCPESTPPPPPPWTVGMAQAVLSVAANDLFEIVERLEEILDRLPPPADLADRQEHRKPYDVATDILATIECVLADDLRPAATNLQRSARVTDAELKRDFKERKRQRRL